SQEALTLAERAMEEWRHSWQQLGDELAASERAEHVEATRLEQLAGQEQRLEKELAKNVEERSALTFAALEERLETLAAEEARLSTAAEEATRGLADVWQQIQALREQDGTISAELDQLREQLQNDRGRLASLEALQEAALGKS